MKYMETMISSKVFRKLHRKKQAKQIISEEFTKNKIALNANMNIMIVNIRIRRRAYRHMNQINNSIFMRKLREIVSRISRVKDKSMNIRQEFKRVSNYQKILQIFKITKKIFLKHSKITLMTMVTSEKSIIGKLKNYKNQTVVVQ